MYLYLAIFWFAFGVVLRFFWPELEPHLRQRGITVDRNVISFMCFVLFCYNMIRWRMTQALRRALEKAKEDNEDYRRKKRMLDPSFDVSDQIKDQDDRIQGRDAPS